MVSRYSPAVLYLNDDGNPKNNINEYERNHSYDNSHSSINCSNLSRKRRSLQNDNIQMNSSAINWTKRQRTEYYQEQLRRHQAITYQSDMFNYNSRLAAYNHDVNDESPSFHAFNWTNDGQTAARIYPNPPLVPQMSVIPPANVMNVAKQQLNPLDTRPIYSQYHHRQQQTMQKSINMPMNTNSRISIPSSSMLPLPLPTPTSLFSRAESRSIHPEKLHRLSYSPSNQSHSIHQPIKQTYQSSSQTHRPYSPTSATIPVSTSDILRQSSNASGNLSAFYDSKYYRCNTCKFKALTSCELFEHLFTHIFCCNQCSFYADSHHQLYQHIFEKHSHHGNECCDPKTFELLYVTRCSDGRFALCMDTSSKIVSTPTSTTQIPVAAPKNSDKLKRTTKTLSAKRKVVRRQTRQKTTSLEQSTVTSAEHDKNICQPTPSTIKSSSIQKEKSNNTYVLMKHRHCYASVNTPCLHSLTLEYNICRERTIRHICHTHSITKRRKFQAKLKFKTVTDVVAICLKSIVNDIVSKDDNHNSTDLICLLPNHILSRIYSIDHLESLMTILQLTNKYTKSIEENHQYSSESLIRTSNQHVFMLSSSSVNKAESSTCPLIQTSITGDDSPYTQTKLQTLPISCDNTHRFLKGHLYSVLRTIALQSIQNGVHRRSSESNHSETVSRQPPKSSIDQDNPSNTSSQFKASTSPVVIVLD